MKFPLSRNTEDACWQVVVEVAGEQQQPELVPTATRRRHADATHTGTVLRSLPEAQLGDN